MLEYAASLIAHSLIRFSLIRKANQPISESADSE
jgi:hypothetical protein